MTSTAGDQSVRVVMRAPCPRCGGDDGNVATVNGQDTVRCAECNQFCYNAPRSETGREARSLRTRPNIRPSQRARILARDNGTCILCHRSGVPLDVGHLISVHDGYLVGLSDADLSSDDLLAAMCTACNSGLSKRSLPPRWLAAALWAGRLNDGDDGDRRPA
jgi:5-methylcytosine-specific restriction endonuclease McrA